MSGHALWLEGEFGLAHGGGDRAASSCRSLVPMPGKIGSEQIRSASPSATGSVGRRPSRRVGLRAVDRHRVVHGRRRSHAVDQVRPQQRRAGPN